MVGVQKTLTVITNKVAGGHGATRTSKSKQRGEKGRGVGQKLTIFSKWYFELSLNGNQILV